MDGGGGGASIASSLSLMELVVVAEASWKLESPAATAVPAASRAVCVAAAAACRAAEDASAT